MMWLNWDQMSHWGSLASFLPVHLLWPQNWGRLAHKWHFDTQRNSFAHLLWSSQSQRQALSQSHPGQQLQAQLKLHLSHCQFLLVPVWAPPLMMWLRWLQCSYRPEECNQMHSLCTHPLSMPSSWNQHNHRCKRWGTLHYRYWSNDLVGWLVMDMSHSTNHWISRKVSYTLCRLSLDMWHS